MVPGDPSALFPYLVDLSTVTAVEQVCATGFISNLSLRNVLSWKLSNSFDTEFFLDALEIALEGGHKTKIFQFDQGCQFTSGNFVPRLQSEAIRISWSGTVSPQHTGCEAVANSPVRSHRLLGQAELRSISVPTLMAGRLRSVLLTFCGGTAL